MIYKEQIAFMNSAVWILLVVMAIIIWSAFILLCRPAQNKRRGLLACLTKEVSGFPGFPWSGSGRAAGGYRGAGG